jgi:hypothetical protein
VKRCRGSLIASVPNVCSRFEQVSDSGKLSCFGSTPEFGAALGRRFTCGFRLKCLWRWVCIARVASIVVVVVCVTISDMVWEREKRKETHCSYCHYACEKSHQRSHRCSRTSKHSPGYVGRLCEVAAWRCTLNPATFHLVLRESLSCVKELVGLGM